jgi:hypothetical protein
MKTSRSQLPPPQVGDPGHTEWALLDKAAFCGVPQLGYLFVAAHRVGLQVVPANFARTGGSTPEFQLVDGTGNGSLRAYLHPQGRDSFERVEADATVLHRRLTEILAAYAADHREHEW